MDFRELAKERRNCTSLIILSLIITLAVCSILCSETALAYPPVAAEYYGDITIDARPAKEGTVIKAYDPDGTLCGTFTVKTTGKYGVLSCKGDDLNTAFDEGGVSGDNIIFILDRTILTPAGETSWGQGIYRQVNLSKGAKSAIIENPKNISAFPNIIAVFLVLIMLALAILAWVVLQEKKDSQESKEKNDEKILE